MRDEESKKREREKENKRKIEIETSRERQRKRERERAKEQKYRMDNSYIVCKTKLGLPSLFKYICMCGYRTVDTLLYRGQPQYRGHFAKTGSNLYGKFINLVHEPRGNDYAH